jgi:DNA invertase Pin-like site-specific DNA recombinase
MPRALKAAPSIDPLRNQAVVYARVSSKEQEREGFSIPAQLKLLKEYAAARSVTVAQEYVDVETAKQTGRAAFGEMVAYLKAHPAVRVLLVEKTDRLYRNLRDWVTVDDLDVEIHFPKEGVVLSRGSRSSEKFIHGIKVLMAKNYIDNLSEEARKGMQEKAEQGIWPTVASLGYRNLTGPDGKKIIEPDPETGPLIARLFEWYAAGTLSLREAAKKVRAVGLVHGKKWCTGTGEHGARDTAKSALRRGIRVERSPLPRDAPTTRFARALGASAERARWPSSQQTPPGKAQLRLFRPDRMRPLRLLDRERDQEAAVRLLPLHRVQGPLR